MARKRNRNSKGAKKPAAKQRELHWRSKPGTVSRQQHLREVRSRFDLFPISTAARNALKIKRRGAEKLSKAELVDFLKNNRGALMRVMASEKLGARKVGRVVRERLTKMTEKSLLNMVLVTIDSIRLQAVRALYKGKLEKHLLKYFKARGIPIKTKTEVEAFQATFAEQFLRQVPTQP